MPADQEAALERHVRPGEQLFYVQHGHSFGLGESWRAFVDTLTNLRVRAVCCTGRLDIPLGVLPLEALAFGHVNQSWVMSRADCVLGQGHATAYLGALVHGVPQVLAPGGVDTYENASRAEELGVGLRLWEEPPTPWALQRTIRTVLHDRSQCRQRAKQLAEQLSGETDFARAANVIETLGARRAVEPDGSSARR